jgi:tRNA U55 pseudouridine synthase TruB
VINEKEIHLKEVILDIGVRLRTSTLSESVRRTSIGSFQLAHSLVLEEITPENLLANIESSANIIEHSKLLDKTILVNENQQNERQLLGRGIDENAIELYKNKRWIDHSFDNE